MSHGGDCGQFPEAVVTCPQASSRGTFGQETCRGRSLRSTSLSSYAADALASAPWPLLPPGRAPMSACAQKGEMFRERGGQTVK